MSRYTHALCVGCWNALHPDRRVAENSEQYRGGPRTRCCRCSQETDSGIYFRAEPDTLACKGAGPEHEEER